MLQTFVENSPLATVLLDGTGRIITCNASFEQLFGFSFTDVSQRPLQEIMPFDDDRSYGESESPTALDNQLLSRFYRFQRADGGIVDLELFHFPIEVDPRGPMTVTMFEDCLIDIEE